MTTDMQTTNGGRINMIELPMQASDGYIDANYAELKIRAKYNGRQTDTLFVFYFGPSEFIKDGATSYPTQYAFNSTENFEQEQFIENWENGNKESIYVEGGSGYKPVVKAAEIKKIVNELIKTEAPDADSNSVVINRLYKSSTGHGNGDGTSNTVV